MITKDKWIADRAERLQKGSVALLVRCAEDAVVPISDLDSVRELARRIAEAEWGARAEASKPTGFAERVGEEPWPGYPLADELNAMEPVEGEDPAVRKLKAQIMERWISAIGGMDWYNGPTNQSALARSEGKALAAVLDDVLHGGVVRGSNPHGIQTRSGWFIYEVILPQVLEHFFKKNADYGDNHRDGLGPRAEYVGIHRKVKKLEKALWNGETMNGESAEEMLTDLIGQCLITLDLLQGDST